MVEVDLYKSLWEQYDKYVLDAKQTQQATRERIDFYKKLLSQIIDLSELEPCLDKLHKSLEQLQINELLVYKERTSFK